MLSGPVIAKVSSDAAWITGALLSRMWVCLLCNSLSLLSLWKSTIFLSFTCEPHLSSLLGTISENRLLFFLWSRSKWWCWFETYIYNKLGNMAFSQIFQALFRPNCLSQKRKLPVTQISAFQVQKSFLNYHLCKCRLHYISPPPLQERLVLDQCCLTCSMCLCLSAALLWYINMIIFFEYISARALSSCDGNRMEYWGASFFT